MLRPVSLLPALVAVTSMTLLPSAPGTGAASAAAPAARRAPAAADPSPLAVSIDNLSPSAIPRSGPVRVSGSVTNQDDAPWSTINMYAFISSSPMTTSAALTDATEAAPDQFVGARITAPGTSDTVDLLAPGQTAQYTLRIRRSQLPVRAAGVYWFGVHALGEGPEGRLLGADGRARTFLPLVPATTRSVDTALVLPIRHEINHRADGRVAGVRSWTRALGPGGELRAMVDFGASAGARPLTWLVDPAVPDAVRALVAGNRPRSLSSTTGEDGGDPGDPGDAGSGGDDESPQGAESPESPEASESPTDDPTAEDGEAGDAEEPGPALAAAVEAGSTWLARFQEALEGGQILALPYGDVDVAAAADYDPELYEQARKRSDGDLEPWGLPTSPVVAPPSGFIDSAGIEQTEAGTTVLVTDRMFGENPPAVADLDGHTLAVTSTSAMSGGPGPDDPLAPVAVRQRIVSEAAMRLLNPGREPLIVSLPSSWTPEASSGFFAGLDLDWLNLTSVRAVTARDGRTISADALDYPQSQEALQLDPANFAAAAALVRAGDTLQNLLTENDRVGSAVRDEALADTSYAHRQRPGRARASAQRSRTWIERRLRSVRINAPRAVILSGGSGRFAATITNGLAQPVTVRIDALTDPPLSVAVPADSVEVGPESRATVLLNASSSALGVRNVTLALTDTQGVPLGSSDDLPIRSNQVSNVIWLILGTGVALLFGAIVVRLFRRIRTAARS